MIHFLAPNFFIVLICCGIILSNSLLLREIPKRSGIFAEASTSKNGVKISPAFTEEYLGKESIAAKLFHQ